MPNARERTNSGPQRFTPKPFCWACNKSAANLYETRFGRRLWFCDDCRDRLDVGPLIEVTP